MSPTSETPPAVPPRWSGATSAAPCLLDERRLRVSVRSLHARLAALGIAFRPHLERAGAVADGRGSGGAVPRGVLLHAADGCAPPALPSGDTGSDPAAPRLRDGRAKRTIGEAL